ncbi:UNVERIFIED_CONTAM: hypothetical protein RMT77_012924 [Armadillidium vulgare]
MSVDGTTPSGAVFFTGEDRTLMLGEEDNIATVLTKNRSYSGLETTVAVILLGYLILGLSGNLLTIIALLRCQRVRNVTAAFIISLCVADCLFCVLVLPWEVSRFFAGKWVWGRGLICTVLPLIRYWNVAVSLLSIAMITLNRYIMIAHFRIYKSVYKKRWIALMIAFCWLFPFCILLPTLFGKWGRFGMIQALETCSIIDENGQSPKKVLFGLGFCVPALVIVICYSLIFYVIHKSDLRMRNHNTRETNGAATPGVSLQTNLPGKIEKEAKRKKNEWRITKMVMIIFLAFVITYLPITLVKFFDPEVNYRALHLVGYVLVYLSCCINPVIYVIMNRQYRQAYRSVLLCKNPILNSFSSHGDDNGVEKTGLKRFFKNINVQYPGHSWRNSVSAHDNTSAVGEVLPPLDASLHDTNLQTNPPLNTSGEVNKTSNISSGGGGAITCPNAYNKANIYPNHNGADDTHPNTSGDVNNYPNANDESSTCSNASGGKINTYSNASGEGNICPTNSGEGKDNPSFKPEE